MAKNRPDENDMFRERGTLEGGDDGVVEEGPQPQDGPNRPADLPHQVTPDGRPYLVRVPNAVWFLATPLGGFLAVDEKLIRAQLGRYWPDLETFAQDKEGNWKPMSAEALFRAYGSTTNDKVVFRYAGVTSFMYDTNDPKRRAGTLHIRVVSEAAPPPTRHDDVLNWLRVLAGPAYERVLDWLATATMIDQPTCALVLEGPHSLGKSMLAFGLAAYFGASVADYDDVFKGRFNDALLRSPIVFLDEGAQADARSAVFRKLIGNTSHAIEAKNRPTATLIGCPRLIVAANNADALRLGREDLTREDEEAIGERILRVPCDPVTAAWLTRQGGRAFTREWVTRDNGAPGLIAETIAWLRGTRVVEHGPRFLVHGNAAEWTSRIATRQGLPATVLEAFELWRDDSRMRGEIAKNNTPPFVLDKRHPDHVLVSNEGLRDAWRRILGEPPPTHRKLAVALGVLARNGREFLPVPDRYARLWVYVVPLALVPEPLADGHARGGAQGGQG